MFLLLILPVLVSGFIVCNKNPRYYFRLHRYHGQHLYLKSAYLGVISLIIFSITALLCNKFFPSSLSLFGWTIPTNFVFITESLLRGVLTKNNENLTSHSWFVIVFTGTILTAYLWCFFAWIRLGFGYQSRERAKMNMMYDLLKDSPLDKLLFMASIDKDLVLLTLQSRKVYVGYVTSLGEPNETEGMDQEITIIPQVSGYRIEDTLKVEFNTHYNHKEVQVNLVIRQEQILSATLFDYTDYATLNPPADEMPVQQELDLVSP